MKKLKKIVCENSIMIPLIATVEPSQREHYAHVTRALDSVLYFFQRLFWAPGSG